MKFTAIAAFITLALAADTFTCNKYSCDATFKDPNACMKFDLNSASNQIYLKACPQDMVCDPALLKNDEALCAKSYSTPMYYPGEYCRSDSECFSRKCVKDVCEGLSKGKACARHRECDKGLRCLNKKCEPTLEAKGKCTAAEECNVNLVCDNGECVKIGSKKVGDLASAPGACATFYTKAGRCEQAPKLKSSSDTECVYTNESKDTPLCGMTATGKKFCNYAAGDVNIQDVLFNTNY
eukprot:TRINITY_DN205_c0_g1_i1.p1 TRINITY_DN205_c0_g1~~TRINITY_DN205_c0_g1_i1.p1  ORF type:complete len:238 (-),score=47.32 TRINITY_DN205_c0_g1_i1:349-1062(-)